MPPAHQVDTVAQYGQRTKCNRGRHSRCTRGFVLMRIVFVT
jgi:hypothetical protein